MRLRGKQLDAINAALKTGNATDFNAALQKTCSQVEAIGQFVPAPSSASDRKCPKCGKPMKESPKWPGLWQCVDYGKPLNDKPPYRYQCTGLEITDEGVQGFDEACLKIICERN